MITKIKYPLFILILILASACNSKKPTSPSKTPAETTMEFLDETLSSLMKDLSIESYGYALITNTDILKLEENGITVDQVFEAGELSRLFLGTLILQSEEKGLLDIKDRLGQYGIQGEEGKASFKSMLSYTFQPDGHLLNYQPGNYPLAGRALETATGKKISKLFRSGCRQKLNMKKSSMDMAGSVIHCSSTMNDLIQFSMAVDNQELFKDENTQNMMFRPVYLETGERSLSGLGCYIYITNDQKYIWSEDENEEYSSLLIKSSADSVSLIILAHSPDMNKPFDLESGKIWNSPFYHAYRKLFISPDSTTEVLDFYGDHGSLQESIQKMLDNGKRDEVYDELVSYIKMYSWNQNKERLQDLTQLYQEFFAKDLPLELLNQNPVAEIDRVMDYMQLLRHFSLEKDTTLKIFTTAEFDRVFTMNPWEYDNLELFFDLKHERTPSFNSADDDRHLRFNYDHPGVTGNAPTFEGIRWIQYDPDPKHFNFEIAIPWSTLFNSDSVHPSHNQPIGFDIAIADNDAEVREGSLAWRAKLGEQPWANTSNFGSMILADQAGPGNDTICYAIYTRDTIIIDGKNTGEWNNIPRYTTESVLFEGIQGPEDQAGWFRIRWDEKNLYLFVEFYDDVKRLLDPSQDFGWITNLEGDTIWIMNKGMGISAGNAGAYELYTGKVLLKAGDYQLHYQSNQTNSYGRWTNERPEVSFYGILLYE